MTDQSLYDRDIVAWAEEQAAALRRLAERPDLTNAIDWENVTDEVESVGRSQFHGVEGKIFQVFVHVLKGYCDSDSLSARQWSSETRSWLRDIRKRFTPSMRQKLEIDDTWREAGSSAAIDLAAYGVAMPPGIPAACPFTLDEILAEDFTFEAACRKLHDRTAARVAANKDRTS